MTAMKHYSCWTILYLLIFAVLIITPGAQSVDCYTEIKVHRNTVYYAPLGQQLWINCTVIFCNDSPPTVSWYKVEETSVPVNVTSDSHIITEWKRLNKSVGISYLIFQNILRNDSGQYLCQGQGGGSVSHFITVNVFDNVKLTTASWTTLAPVNTTSADNFWPFIYRVVGSVVFVTVVILICVTSKRGCKGKLRKTTKPSQELYTHIYDNDI